MNLKNHWMLTGVLTIVAAIILPYANASAEDPVPTLRTVLIIDESGSMNPPLAWLATELEVAQASGEAEMYDARPAEFGLVLFTDHAKSISFEGRLFGTIGEVTEVLKTGSSATSGEEDGYQAIREALSTYEESPINGLHLLQRYPGILVAKVSASPTIVEPGETVMLDGGRSRHMRSGEQIESWSWDYDDDGEEDAWGVVVATSFDETGDHVVVLRVMDRDGNASLARQIIHVE